MKKFMLLFSIYIGNPIVYGFVFQKLWEWFIVTKFQMPMLTLWEAIGIMITLKYSMAQRPKPIDESAIWEETKDEVVFVHALSIIALLSGWIVKIFI